MIYFDTTRASSWKHASGLTRVTSRLLAELGPSSATGTQWPQLAAAPGRSDWLLTPELFSEEERPGFSEFLSSGRCRTAAIYHDAIPIRFPQITWPASVERHPGYMKLLSRFERVWAVSNPSRDELLGFWKWQGVTKVPQVDVLTLGADWPGVARGSSKAGGGPLKIVSVGILEPRKNQSVLLDAYERLRAEGVEFELHLVGRVNPHFGAPIAKRVGGLAAAFPGLHHHPGMDDSSLAALIQSARATAFPSIAEGCGLPVLESLWMGTPCVCSDIAPVAGNAAGGGCLVVPGNTPEGWLDSLRRILSDDALHASLHVQALRRELPTWSGAAAALRAQLA